MQSISHAIELLNNDSELHLTTEFNTFSAAPPSCWKCLFNSCIIEHDETTHVLHQRNVASIN